MCAAWGWGQMRPPGLRAPLLLVIRCLAQILATGFHRFLARFSGRRRPHGPFDQKSPPWTILALVVVTSLFSIVDACSSRTTPKPRPPAPTPRPNVTFLTFPCPPAYAAWYCLNGATCFTVKIGESLLYNCECATGYMGPRCEYKDLDRSYLPAQRKIMLEKASIAGGATIAVFLVVIICATMYLHYKRRTKAAQMGKDCVDGGGVGGGGGGGGGIGGGGNSNIQLQQPTFGTKWRTQSQQHQQQQLHHQTTTTTTTTTLPFAAVHHEHQRHRNSSGAGDKLLHHHHHYQQQQQQLQQLQHPVTQTTQTTTMTTSTTTLVTTPMNP